MIIQQEIYWDYLVVHKNTQIQLFHLYIAHMYIYSSDYTYYTEFMITLDTQKKWYR